MCEPLPLAGRLRGLHPRQAGVGSCRQDNGQMAGSRGAGSFGRFARDEEQPRGRGTGQRCHGGTGRERTRRPASHSGRLRTVPPRPDFYHRGSRSLAASRDVTAVRVYDWPEAASKGGSELHQIGGCGG